MKRAITSFLMLFLLPVGSMAQDVHFSQFFASPLTVNPANTAFFDDDWRVGLNYKNQWPWGSSTRGFTFRTVSVYGDASIFNKRLPIGDKLGVGGNVVYDQAGDGQLSVTKARLTTAYHLSLDRFNQFYLSLGGGLAFVQKDVDQQELFFNSQWTDGGFDRSLPSGESPDDNGLNFIDVTIGANFSGDVSEKVNINSGLSLYHVNRPVESFYGNDNRLGVRPVANAGATIQATERITVSPSVMYSNQKRAQEAVLGSMMSYRLPVSSQEPQQKIYFGSYYRWADAFIPLVGYQYQTLRVLLNYDVNASSLTDASGGQGGVELSVVYTGIIPGNDQVHVLPCPRM